MDDFAALRQRMVDNQIRPSEITEPVLIRALLDVARERFVSEDQRPFAYSDREISLSGEGRARRLMLDPVQLARLIQALNVTPSSNVLDLATGTGYSAAVLSRLAGTVVALEEDPVLARQAEENLRAVAATNVNVVKGKLTDGYSGAAPYDAILVNGSVEVMPERLLGQLRIGGLLGVVERQDRLSRAMLYERIGTDVSKWPIFEAFTGAVLPGFEREAEFVF